MPDPERHTVSADLLGQLEGGNVAQVYARLRAEAPVHFSRLFGGWVITRRADALAILGDPTFRADEPVERLERLEDGGGPQLANLKTAVASVPFFTNSPRHEQLRRFTSRLFRELDVAGLRAAVEARADRLLADARLCGGLDLAGGWGNDLAPFAIGALLGLPTEETARLAAIVRSIFWIFDVAPRSLRAFARANAELGLVLDYFEPRIADARRRPSTTGFARLVALNDLELGLDDRALCGLCAFFFVGGQETTATGIATASMLLLGQPGLRRRMTAEPESLSALARELLRLAAPFQYVTRVATTDRVIAGRRIAAGDRLNVVLGAANRDPEAFGEPDIIDIDRTGPESLTFGFGAYRCLGARMAQLETEVALERLIGQPDLRLVPETVEFERRVRVPALARAWAEFVPGAEP